jgi:hypothetical protein
MLLYQLSLERARALGMCPNPANDVLAVIVSAPLPNAGEADRDPQAEPVSNPEQRVERDIGSAPLDADVVASGHPDLLGDGLLREVGGLTGGLDAPPDLGGGTFRSRV